MYLSKNNTNQVQIRSATYIPVVVLAYVKSLSKSTYWLQSSSVMFVEEAMEDLDKGLAAVPYGKV